MSGTTPLPMPLEPTPPVHIISPAAPAQPAHQLQEPVSPPPALASPQVTSQPAQVEGVVSERQHQPPPQPAIEPSAPPSVDPTQTLLLPSADPLHVPKTGVLRVLAATPSLRCFVCQRLIR